LKLRFFRITLKENLRKFRKTLQGFLRKFRFNFRKVQSKFNVAHLIILERPRACIDPSRNSVWNISKKSRKEATTM